MFIPDAWAQAGSTAGSAGAGSTAAFLAQIVPLILIFVVFYFLMIRPQQRRMKEHREKVAAIKVRDTVVTAGGLVGKVARIDDDYVDVEIAPGVKVKVVRSTLADVQKPGGKPAND